MFWKLSHTESRLSGFYLRKFQLSAIEAGQSARSRTQNIINTIIQFMKDSEDYSRGFVISFIQQKKKYGTAKQLTTGPSNVTFNADYLKAMTAP